jgi:hypothetical protein
VYRTHGLATYDNRSNVTKEAHTVDSDRFDAFVRSLNVIAPRRAALVGALGTGISVLLLEDVTARKKKRKKKKCKVDTKKCGKTCIPKTECCGGCDAEQECCSGTCSDLVTDGANCGECGNACVTGGCVQGFCTCQSQEDCNGCVCSLRLEDAETACSGDLTTHSCSVDADCPARSFCRDTINGGFCTEPCLA